VLAILLAAAVSFLYFRQTLPAGAALRDNPWPARHLAVLKPVSGESVRLFEFWRQSNLILSGLIKKARNAD
jgi:hypothetical protein